MKLFEKTTGDLKEAKAIVRHIEGLGFRAVICLRGTWVNGKRNVYVFASPLILDPKAIGHSFIKSEEYGTIAACDFDKEKIGEIIIEAHHELTEEESN